MHVDTRDWKCAWQALVPAECLGRLASLPAWLGLFGRLWLVLMHRLDVAFFNSSGHGILNVSWRRVRLFGAQEILKMGRWTLQVNIWIMITMRCSDSLTNPISLPPRTQEHVIFSVLNMLSSQCPSVWLWTNNSLSGYAVAQTQPRTYWARTSFCCPVIICGVDKDVKVHGMLDLYSWTLIFPSDSLVQCVLSITFGISASECHFIIPAHK